MKYGNCNYNGFSKPTTWYYNTSPPRYQQKITGRRNMIELLILSSSTSEGYGPLSKDPALIKST